MKKFHLFTSDLNIKMNRVVIKLGTQVLIEENKATGLKKLSTSRINKICKQILPFLDKNSQIIIVSSGAVGLGQTELKLKSPLKIIEKQACASVGQTLLMQCYQKFFNKKKIKIGQILLTAEDFSNRENFLNLSHTIEKLLSLGVVPIINENDSVSTSELKENTYAPSFGDNDKLSALVASKLKANLLILLTTTDGIYNKNPEVHNDARRISVVEDFNELTNIDCTGKSNMGRGGMQAKLEAAKIASLCGVPTIIASGILKNSLSQCLNFSTLKNSTQSGTLILPQIRIPEKKQWLAFSSGYRGIITINDGAMEALIHKKSSLLPGGILKVSGSFPEKSILSIQTLDGREIGRGMSSFSSKDLSKIIGKKSKEIVLLLNENAPSEVIHRDHLALFLNHDHKVKT